MTSRPNIPVRVRFAPSPTGNLHLGGARTALFNFLFARHHGGVMLLRIEDTDRERSTEAAIAAILDGMRWLDLTWDEGPVFQTSRLDRYRDLALDLIARGHAYRCVCTPDELEERRKDAQAKGLPPRYDGRCRDRKISADTPHVVRFRNIPDQIVAFDDLIRGPLSFDSGLLDDLVILRTDGMPTYNFAVVVDDADMKITHVIRGDDHINNTPRQIPIFRALGADIPDFAHLPMIFGSDRTKLSKRHGATSVMAYREMGYLPHALANYLVRLGWSHKDQEIFTREELIAHFDLDHVGSSPSVFNPEKLLWLNAHYIKNASDTVLSPLVSELLPPLSEPLPQASDPDHRVRVVSLLKGRAKTLLELAEFSLPYFDRSLAIDPVAREKALGPESVFILEPIFVALSSLPEWSADPIKNVFTQIGEALNKKLGELAQPVRVALTGKTVSPGIFDVLLLAGREISLVRIEAALALARTPFSMTSSSPTGKDLS
ncbi:MAG: glutamate--tRNA ligase [Leptospirillia bacterium]